MSEDVLPLDQCSISQLPFSAMASYKNIKGVEQYTQSRGWFDMPCFKTLDEGTKTRINLLQEQHGLQVTNFDALYVTFDGEEDVEGR
jgi:hypothetical protein